MNSAKLANRHVSVARIFFSAGLVSFQIFRNYFSNLLVQMLRSVSSKLCKSKKGMSILFKKIRSLDNSHVLNYGFEAIPTRPILREKNLRLHEDEPRPGKKPNKTWECVASLFSLFVMYNNKKIQTVKKVQFPVWSLWLCRWYTNHVDWRVEGSFCNVMSGLLLAMVNGIKGL